MNRKKIWKKAMVTGCAGLLAAAMLAGCASGTGAGSSTDENKKHESTSKKQSGQGDSETDAVKSYDVSALTLDTENMFSDRDLEGTYDETEAVMVTLSDDAVTVSDDSVKIDGQTVTISKEGVYVFSGSLSDGQIVVDADDQAKVQIVLNGCEITSKTSAAVYVKSADKVFLTLAEGTKNVLANTDTYETDGDEKINAVVYAKDDLTINGTGTLTITAANGNGIRAKDDLKLVGATLSIDAKKHAISANDSIRVHSGSYTLKAGKDGLHISNEDDGEKGYLYVLDGTFEITGGTDGVDASGMVQIDGGTMNIAAGDDGVHADAKLVINDGSVVISKSEEGLEGYDVIINDGTIDITSDDDGINATAGKGSQSGGFGQGGPGNGKTFRKGERPEGENGFAKGGRPDGDSSFAKGEQSEKGAHPGKGKYPSKDNESENDGKSENDEITENNEKTENDGTSDNAEPAGQDTADTAAFTYTGDVDLAINGGKITISAEGDGIDSNGTITITGGETFIDGPSKSGNGSMDTGDGFEATITGGTIVAVCADGMAENFGSSSTQGAILQSVESTTGEITLKDSDGKELISFTPSKTYSSVLISTPDLQKGETYTLTTGKTSTEINMTGLIYGQSQEMGGMRQQKTNGSTL